MNGFNHIDTSLLEAKNSQRLHWVYVGKEVILPDKVYVPLYQDIKAKPITGIFDIAIPMPVAVYVLDREWGKKNITNCYVYSGDSVK